MPSPLAVTPVWRPRPLWFTDEVAEPNVFAVDVAIAAFTKGEEWLEQLREYIYENKQITEKFIKDNIPRVSMVESHATYLCWLDVSDITDNSTRLAAYIRKNCQREKALAEMENIS